MTTPPAYRAPDTYYEETRARRNVWPWLLGLLACAIAAVGGYLIYQKIENQLNTSKPIAVQDVRNIVASLATQKLQAQGFDVKVKHQPDDTIPAGQVVDQDPSAGSRIARTSTVTIFVSTGKPKVELPDVRGKTVNEAISILTNLHLTPDVHYLHSSAASNTVVGEGGKPGDQVLAGSKVRLNVSQGPKLVSIPNVVATPFANAQSALEGLNFVVVKKFAPSDQPKGEVVSTDPQGGTPAPAGTKVTVTVSNGPSTSQVPDVTGRQQADAEQTLRNSGFSTITIVKEDVFDPSQDGLVLSENPRPGTKAKQGTTVTITVGRLVQTTTAATTTTATTTTTTTATTTASTP